MALFERIPKDKRLLIIGAAYSCFGKNGYQKTSMADIAERAGISKASLFQYFGTKKSLYLFLYRYAVEEILNRTPEGSEDLFECISAASMVKLEVLAKHPGMFDFMASTMDEESPEIAEDLRALAGERVGHGVSVLFAKVDWSHFKPEITRETAINAITWMSEGYIRSALGHKDAEAMRNELAGYMELLKKAFYQEEYL